MNEYTGPKTLDKFVTDKDDEDNPITCLNYCNYRLTYINTGKDVGPLKSYDLRTGKTVQLAPIVTYYVLANNRAYYLDTNDKLFSVKLDGTDRRKISDFPLYGFAIGTKSIFFVKGKNHRVNLKIQAVAPKGIYSIFLFNNNKPVKLDSDSYELYSVFKANNDKIELDISNIQLEPGHIYALLVPADTSIKNAEIATTEKVVVK